MKHRFLPSLIVLTVFLAACAPAESTATSAAPTAVEPSVAPSPTPLVNPTASADLAPTDTVDVLSATPSIEAQPVATSRGPNLEATDPTTVNFASGGLQLVEFFRFT
jgi:hypothetical protein